MRLERVRMADVLTHMPSRLTATIRSANGDRPQSRLCRFCLIGVACAWVAAHRAAAHVRQSAPAARQQFADHALLWLVPATTVATLTPLGDINGIPGLEFARRLIPLRFGAPGPARRRVAVGLCGRWTRRVVTYRRTCDTHRSSAGPVRRIALDRVVDRTAATARRVVA